MIIAKPSWALTALLVVGVALIGAALWFAMEDLLLAVDGDQASATVVAKRIDPTHYSGRGDDNGYFATVAFTPAGAAPVQSEHLVASRDAWTSMSVGSVVGVEYVKAFPEAMNVLVLPGAPGVGLLDALLPFALPGGMGLVFAFIGARYLRALRGDEALVRRLRSVGVVTTGTVVTNDAGRLWVAGNLQRRISFHYADGSGGQHTATSGWMPLAQAREWKARETGVVRYDPARPGLAAWYGREPGDPAVAPGDPPAVRH